MNWIEALILGLVQGLTEFLPVSSSGHLELGKVILNAHFEDDLAFTVVVHAATVFSILFVFWKDIIDIITNVFRLKWNDEMKFLAKIFLSMIPVAIIGLIWERDIEDLFNGRVLMVGIMLIFTSIILFSSNFSRQETGRDVSFVQALIIGIAQAIAVIPGISRSGTTIGTALILGVEKTKATRFSFLMVLIPIIGASAVKVKALAASTSHVSIDLLPLIVGFFAAFFSGLLACKWMLSIVKRGKLNYFAIYCLVIGLIAIIYKIMI